MTLEDQQQMQSAELGRNLGASVPSQGSSEPGEIGPRRIDRPRKPTEFKKGDVHPDGRVFEKYTFSRKAWYEYWVHPDKFVKYREWERGYKRNRYRNDPTYYRHVNDRNSENQKKRLRTNPRRMLLHGSVCRAKKRGLPHNITIDDIYIPEACPILGIPLILGDGRASDNSPSLDRLVPELGYVKGNVAVISSRANRIKSNSLPKELLAIAHWYEKQLCSPDK